MKIKRRLSVFTLFWMALGVHILAADAPSGTIQFSEAGRPEVVAWAVEGESESFVRWLNDDNFEVTLPAGDGCLVLVKSDYLPILEATEIEDGSERSVSELEWAEGPSFLGSVVDSEDLPVPATVRFAETATPKGAAEKLCREALAAAEFYETQASSSGHFESPPLLPGRYVLTFEAPDHAAVERVLVIDGKQPEYDLGAITLHVMARIDVVLDASDIDLDPPFELAVDSENPTSVKQKDRWEAVEKIEVTPDVSVEVISKPGRHRLTLTKTGFDLQFVAIETYSPGWQETVLHPQPIFLEGTVTANDLPVENAEVAVFSNDLMITSHTDMDGAYEVTLWLPGHYGATARAPNGDSQVEIIDLRETVPGETVERDFDLSTGEISGRVVSSVDQSPIEGCKVGLRQESTERGNTRRTESAADGTFSFSGVWDADKTSLNATMDGYLRKEIAVTYVGESINDIWIELDENAAVYGRVVGPSGEPVAGIEVSCCVSGLSGRLSVATITEQDGSFSIDAQPGTTIYARATGYSIGWANALEGEGTVIQLQGLFTPTRVRVQTEKGEPAVGLAFGYLTDSGVLLPSNLVYLHAIQNGLSRETDEAGVIDVSSLPPGVYQVIVRRQSGVSPLGLLPIPSAGEVTLRVPDMKRLRDEEQKAELTTGIQGLWDGRIFR